MKRYLVFAFNDYYPNGGIDDFIDSFDDLNRLTRRVSYIANKDQRRYYEPNFTILINSKKYTFQRLQVIERDTLKDITSSVFNSIKQ